MDVGQFVIEYARQNGPDGSFARDVDLVTAAIAQDREEREAGFVETKPCPKCRTMLPIKEVRVYPELPPDPLAAKLDNMFKTWGVIWLEKFCVAGDPKRPLYKVRVIKDYMDENWVEKEGATLDAALEEVEGKEESDAR